MSLIKRADVKNHLTARHRTEIHVAPVGNTDANAIARNAGDDQKATDLVETPVETPNPNGPKIASAMTPSGQSKSAKA